MSKTVRQAVAVPTHFLVADGTDEASNLGYATVAQAQSQFAVAVPTGAGQADGLMSHEDKAKLDVTPQLAGANTWTAKQTFNLFEAAAGTLVADAPAIISQTWNNAAVAFTGLKIDVTNTASAAGAKPFEISVTGFSAHFDKTANLVFPALGGTQLGAIFGGSTISDCVAYTGQYGVRLSSTIQLAWSSNRNLNSQDVTLRRNAVGVLGLNSASAPSTLNVCGTYTSETNYQRLGVISAKQALTAASGATVATTTLSIPKYSHLIGVTTRVTTALGETNGTTGYTVGDGTDPDLWGAVTGVAIGTATAAPNYTAVDALGPSATDRTVTLTAVGGNFNGTGVIEVCAFYLRAEAD